MAVRFAWIIALSGVRSRPEAASCLLRLDFPKGDTQRHAQATSKGASLLRVAYA